jgi:signal transduction histidine kinase/ActR/RegA family two-component response regulator
VAKSISLEYLAKASLLAIVYVVFARIGLKIHPVNEFATLVWPPTGIALAAILVLGNRFWPSIAAGAVLVNIWTGAPFFVALGIGAGNTLEALVGAYALRRIPGFRTTLDRLSDVLGLVFLAGVVSSAVSATIGVSSLAIGGIVTPERFAVTWRTWWMGDAIGDLIVAPLLLTWRPVRDVAVARPRVAEAALLTATLAATSLFIFELTTDSMASLLAPLLVWAAIRFEQRGAARATFLVSVIAIWATVRGHGPFIRDSVDQSLFILQAFMAFTAGTFLVLGAITSERRRAKEEAEAANRAKDQFLAALSHELRTPLTPVLALSSVLEQNTELPEEARRQIEIVRRNTELEARLIDDLLDLTRIARGKLEVNPEPVDLAEALRHAIEICRPEAATGLVLELEEVNPGTVVWADPARLRQVLWNIVKNAIQFTPPGGRIRLRTVAASPGRIAVEVSDTGAGIEPSEIARIFQPFEQIGQRPGGLGLGLAISRALMEAQGGTLTVSSEGMNRGATFRLELAVSRAKPQSRPVRLVSPGGGPRWRILIVEDHADTLTATHQLLEELSCESFPARSLKEALAAAEAQAFDLVLSDLGLPDGSGLELMRRLHDRYGLLGIAVTGYGMEDDVRRGREAGFVDHLVKPITFQKLASAIERFFAERPVSDSREP